MCRVGGSEAKQLLSPINMPTSGRYHTSTGSHGKGVCRQPLKESFSTDLTASIATTIHLHRPPNVFTIPGHGKGAIRYPRSFAQMRLERYVMHTRWLGKFTDKVDSAMCLMMINENKTCSSSRAQHNSYPSVHPEYPSNSPWHIHTTPQAKKKKGGREKT